MSEGASDSNLTTLTDALGAKDQALVRKIIDSRHSSTLEHIYYNFAIQGISRAALQELARHRIASLSVQSTRYTLSKRLIREQEPFDLTLDFDGTIKRAAQYIKLDDLYNTEAGIEYRIKSLEILRQYVIDSRLKSDITKYALPECWLVDLVWSINARSLHNFLTLRTAQGALLEMQLLSMDIMRALPCEHLELLFEDVARDNALLGL